MTALEVQPATTPADVSPTPATPAAPVAAPQSTPATPVVAAEAPKEAPPVYTIKDVNGQPVTDSEILKAFTEAMGAHKIAPEAAQSIYTRLSQAEEQARKGAIDRMLAGFDAELEAHPELGGARAQLSLENAAKAWEQLGGKELADYLAQSRLGRHPAMVAAGNAYLARVSQDKAHQGTAPTPKPENIADVSASSMARSYFGNKG